MHSSVRENFRVFNFYMIGKAARTFKTANNAMRQFDLIKTALVGFFLIF